MKKTFYTFLFLFFVSLNINAQSQYSSIDDVKRLNYDLLEEIGRDNKRYIKEYLDEKKIIAEFEEIIVNNVR